MLLNIKYYLQLFGKGLHIDTTHAQRTHLWMLGTMVLHVSLEDKSGIFFLCIDMEIGIADLSLLCCNL